MGDTKVSKELTDKMRAKLAAGFAAGDRIEELEALLAKAVEALNNIAYGGAYTDMQIARTTLAELKGETNE